MICQGCGHEGPANEKHTYQDCLDHIKAHPEDFAKVKQKHLYYGKKCVSEEKKDG